MAVAQGGIEPGESAQDAAWRELREETGLTREHVRLVGVLDVWLGYELPTAFRSEKTGAGQVHLWHAFEVKPAVEVPINLGSAEEFRSQRWMELAELLEVTAEFRRPVYEHLSGWLERLGMSPSG